MAPGVPVAVLLAASLTAWAVCGGLRSWSLSRGIVSAPLGARAGPGGVPLLGGLGALAGVAAGLVAAWAAGRVTGSPSLEPPPPWPALAWAGLIAGFAVVGLRDDLAGLSPIARLLLECVWAAGALGLPLVLGAGPADGAAAAPAAASWSGILATAALAVIVANAFNLTDNADGLAAGAGALTLGGLAALLLAASDQAWAAIGGLAGAGALAGFLVWNRPPARLYLGDAGALAFGALVAGLLAGSARTAGPVDALPGLLFVAGYLMIDPTYAILGRLLRGEAPWRGGIDHLSHDLGAALGSWPRAWRLVLAVQAFSVLSGIGVVGGVLPPWTLAAAACPWAGLWLAGARGRHLRAVRRK